jgi:hypothetical protein
LPSTRRYHRRVPALFAPLVAITLGVTFAWLAVAEHKSEEVGWSSHATRVVALFSALIYGPSVALLLFLSPDWSWAYLVDSARVPSALSMLWVLGSSALLVGAYVVAHPALRRRAHRRALALGLAPLAVSVVMAFVLLERLSTDASFRQFHGGFGARAVAGGPLGYELLWVDGLVVVALWSCFRSLGDRHRRPDRHLGRRRPARIH